MREIYVSVDVESDGPIPGPNSMLSFGAAAFADTGLLSDGPSFKGTFEANLELLPGAQGDTKTMEWWKTQPEAWEACRKNLQDPSWAMKVFVAWVKRLPGKPVFVGFPAGYDFLFVYWYMIQFAGESPFSFSALDGKTYAMATMGKDYRESTKKNMPKSWFSKRPHTHKALDDALEQGDLFLSMLRANRKQREAK